MDFFLIKGSFYAVGNPSSERECSEKYHPLGLNQVIMIRKGIFWTVVGLLYSDILSYYILSTDKSLQG